MSAFQIVLGEWRGRPAAALLRDGVLDDFLIGPDDGTPVLGAIYRAVVDRPLPGQGGAIVRLGQGQKGLIRQAKGLKSGERLLVQVTSYAEPGKAAPVTQRLLFKSRYAIVTPEAPGINISRLIKDEADRDRLAMIAHGIELEPGHGAILRSAAAEAPEDAVAEDLAQMVELAARVTADLAGEPELLLDGPEPADIAWRDWPEPQEVAEDAGAFDRFEIAGHLAQAMEAQVPLEGGGSIFVEPTRALVAVDVNTGGDTSPAAGLKANIAAFRLLPRLLRLRGLSGQIVVDAAPMAKKDRVRLEQVVKSALRTDPVETTLAGWTPLGHLELLRKRERLPLHLVP